MCLRLALALAWFVARAIALRNQHNGHAEDTDVRMNISMASQSSTEADSGVELAAGVVLRERYILAQRITEQYGPGKQFPSELRRQFVGTPTNLGTGSFGDTWKAFDSQLQKHVAVKIFYDSDRDEYLTWRSANRRQQIQLQDDAQECSMLKAMMRSANLHSGSKHICQCYEEHVLDAQGTNRPLFLVLELCGKELAVILSEMAKQGQTNVDQARKFLKQALEGIAFIEMLSPPLIHHDLKPGNLVVDGEDLKIIDWGAAIQATKENEKGGSTYSPAYAAPEVGESEGRVAFAQPIHAFDVYALGLIYMEMLCPLVNYKNWIQFGRHQMMLPIFIETWLETCPALRNNKDIAPDKELIASMTNKTPTERPAPSKLLEMQPLKGIKSDNIKEVAPTMQGAGAPRAFGKYSVGQKVMLRLGSDVFGPMLIGSVKNVSGSLMFDLTDFAGKVRWRNVDEKGLALPEA